MNKALTTKMGKRGKRKGGSKKLAKTSTEDTTNDEHSFIVVEGNCEAEHVVEDNEFEEIDEEFEEDHHRLINYDEFVEEQTFLVPEAKEELMNIQLAEVYSLAECKQAILGDRIKSDPVDEEQCIEIDVSHDDAVDPLTAVPQGEEQNNHDVIQREDFLNPFRRGVDHTLPKCTSGDPTSASVPSDSGELEIIEQRTDSSCSQTPQAFTGSVSCCIIQELANNPFSSERWSNTERARIIQSAPPRALSSRLKPHEVHFHEFPWLVICNDTEILYCWPCLLYSGPQQWWTPCATNDFSIKARYHEFTTKHQLAQHSLKTRKVAKESPILRNLLTNNYRQLKESELKSLIQQGRSCQEVVNSERDPTFFKRLYQRIKWLSGSEQLNEMYCWPCLLCRQRSSLGKYNNLDDFSLLFETLVAQHELEDSHIEACFWLKKLEFSKRREQTTINEHHSVVAVHKNQAFVKHLIDVICVDKKKITNTSVTDDGWFDSLTLLASYDAALANFIGSLREEEMSAQKLISSLGPSVLRAIELTMKERIKQQVKDSVFVSIVLEHTSGYSIKNLLAVIIRCVDKNARVVERFYEFIKTSYNQKVFLYDNFVHIVEELDCTSKLVGFTYDGFCEQHVSFSYFNHQVQQLCPLARFFHYSDQNFKIILKQALSHMINCRRLFEILTELGTFFDDCPPLLIKLAEIDKEIERGAAKAPEIWDTSSGFIVSVMRYYRAMLELFLFLGQRRSAWKVGLAVRAEHFYVHLSQPINRILIALIGQIFKVADGFAKIIGSNDSIENLNESKEESLTELQAMKNKLPAFINYHLSTNQASGREFNEQKEYITKECVCVIDTAANCIANRTSEVNRGHFVVKSAMNELISNERCFLLNLTGESNKQNVLVNNELPLRFNTSKIKSEFKLYRNDEMFRNKTLEQLIEVIRDYDMTTAIPEVYKLLQIAVATMPHLYANNKFTPRLSQLREYVKHNSRMTTVDGLMWMEKDLLSEMQSENKFNEDVINRVAEISPQDRFPLIN